MKVLLAYPPVANITQPYLSIPCLSAYLKQHGVDDVTAIDCNIRVTHELLTPMRLRRAFRWCYHALARANGSNGDGDQARPYPKLFNAFDAICINFWSPPAIKFFISD